MRARPGPDPAQGRMNSFAHFPPLWLLTMFSLVHMKSAPDKNNVICAAILVRRRKKKEKAVKQKETQLFGNGASGRET